MDEGAWATAHLLAPLLSPLTWVLWRYNWPRQPGRHTFRARATDGTDATQVGEQRGPHPDGAIGYHTLSMSV
ncbi:MAG: hypothetical protein HGA45_15325 [Chloroflexales bacterium]|nr:hypothetical protein [Chloroflexales bacterium]